jgi:hypothetical protein
MTAFENIKKKAMQIHVNLKKVVLGLLVIGIGIFIVPRGALGDSADNLLGGCLLFQGKNIYTDFFSHHSPLIYYIVSLIYRFFGQCNIPLAQYGFYAAFLLVLFLLFRYTKSYLLIFFLTISYGLTSVWLASSQVLVETWLTYNAFLIFLLLFFHQNMSRRMFWLLFIVVQFSFSVAQPLYTFCAIILLVYFMSLKKYKTLPLILASFVPALLFYLQFNVKDIWSSVIVFNTKYYLPYIGTPIDQYRHFWFLLKQGLTPTVFETILLCIWISLQFRDIKKKLYITSALIAFVLSLRPDGAHLQPLIFFLLIEIWYFSRHMRFRSILLATIIFLMIPLFIGASQIDRDSALYKKLIISHTRVNDSMILIPGKPELHVTLQRKTGSYYYFFLPWIADQPESESRLINDIEKNMVPFILVDNAYNIFGRGTPSIYMKNTLQFLESNPHYIRKDIDNSIRIYLRTL